MTCRDQAIREAVPLAEDAPQSQLSANNLLTLKLLEEDFSTRSSRVSIRGQICILERLLLGCAYLLALFR